MTPAPCDRLDDYLDRTMPEAERTAFAAHLEECPACRQAVAEQERFGDLLRAAVERFEPVPPRLWNIRPPRYRRWLALAGILLLAVALVAPFCFRDPLPEPALPQPEPSVPAEPASPAPEPLAARVRFDANAPVIAVPVASRSPNVTIVWVYAAPVSTPSPTPEERDEP